MRAWGAAVSAKIILSILGIALIVGVVWNDFRKLRANRKERARLLAGEWAPQQDYTEPEEKPMTWRQHAKRIAWGFVGMALLGALLGALYAWGAKL